jgi:DNA repair protein RadC
MPNCWRFSCAREPGGRAQSTLRGCSFENLAHWRGSLARAARLSARSLGLGSAKYAQMQAASELTRRALAAEMKSGVNLGSPTAVRDFLRLSIQNRQVEVFVGLFLDAQNRVVAVEELFSGTLTQTSVFPREVVRRALHHNAAGVIFAHNHPSGVAEPSHADETLTQALKEALALIDVRVLDHFVVGRGATLSFAERGLL